MNNILTYIKWRGDVSFDIAPFNDVDAAVLSEFAYVPLDGIIPDNFQNRITLGEACKKCAKREMMPGHNEDVVLVKMLENAPRFSKLELSGFVQIVNNRMQFCAYTVKIRPGCHLVVFQGTDDSLIGWKEDLQLSYMNEIPAQKCAVEYMNAVGRAHRGEILTCGHSKGGNLTIYAAAFCNESVSNRITRIISFDGPGFNEEVISNVKLKNIKKKVITYAPEGSIVGMLLFHNTKLIPVKCKGADGMTQHDLYNWEMDVKSLYTLPEFSGMGEMNREVLDEWVSRLSNEQREEFVETLFSLFRKQKTLDDLASAKSIVSIIRSYATMDKDKKQALSLVVNNLGTSFRSQIADEVKAWIASRRESARYALEMDWE